METDGLFSLASPGGVQVASSAAAFTPPSADSPLPVRMRPATLDELVGQEHLLAAGSPLRQLVTGSSPMSVILWGPPGTGKTTIAHLVAAATNRKFVAMSALSAGVIDFTVLSSSELLQAPDPVHIVLDLAKVGLDFPSQTLVVTKQFAAQRRPLVLGMIRALVKAVRYMRTNREESVRIAARRTKIDDLERIQRQWHHVAFDLWQEVPRPSEPGFRLVVETLTDRHPRLATLRPSDVFDASFVEELERSGFFANR